MTSTSDILSQIDAATDDWETSPDAMRVNAPPQPVIYPTRLPPGAPLAHFYMDRDGRISQNPYLSSRNRNTDIRGWLR